MTPLYHAFNPTLVAKRERAKEVLREFNARPNETVLRQLYGSLGDGAWIEAPFFCDYGSNTFVGRDLYANTGCVFLDCVRIEIGDRVLLGPGVHSSRRRTRSMRGCARRATSTPSRITIGDDAWLGGGVIVLPGITIGERAVVGAGSVVTHDVPADAIVAGSSARVLWQAAAA